MIADSTRQPRAQLRPALTLTEVLVALFVMALGMISLLTLFPLGAMQVGQALRDDRATQVARNADSYLRAQWRHQVLTQLPYPTNPAAIEPFFAAMDDPNLESRRYYAPDLVYDRYVGSGSSIFAAPATLSATLSTSLTTTGSSCPTSLNRETFQQFNTGRAVPPLPAPTARSAYAIMPANPYLPERSYPVFVDPHGAVSFNMPPLAINPALLWVGADSGNTVIPTLASTTVFLPRRQLLAVESETNVTLKAAKLLSLGGLNDDLTFQQTGTPESAQLGRQGRYTWAAVIQRPRNDIRDTADLQILVFDRRLLPQARGDEYVTTPNAQAIGERTLTVTVPIPDSEKGTVLVRRGGWIMDGTQTYPPTASGSRNAIFYRISSFTEDTTSPAPPSGHVRYILDLETPLQSPVNANSRFYLFNGLIEVFQRPQLRPDTTY